MAQTKRKRQTKHRGNAAGSVTARGRTGKGGTGSSGGSRSGGQKKSREELRQERLNRKPTWTSMAQRAGLASIVMLVLLLFVTKGRILSAVAVAVIAFVLYVPLGYYVETWLWRRRMAKRTPPTRPTT